jgi:CubicO group peptidase (beta-lactamase class C family)
MLAALCAALLLQAPAAVEVQALERAALATRIEEAIEPDPTRPFWGAVLVVWRGVTVYERGFGPADLAGRPVDAHTLFDVGSVSKQFTAAAVLRLIREERLALDDTLGEHFASAPAPQRAITVEQLLGHRSGLRQTAATDVKDSAFDESPKSWERHLLTRPLAFEPGTTFAYCNYNYLLLALLVERRSGRPFEAYVRASVLEPAGMASARFVGECDGDTSLQALRRHRYRRPGPPPKACEWAWGPGYRGATGLLCSLDGLRAWHAALATDAVFDSRERALAFATPEQRYSCGWYASADEHGRVWHSHDGRTDGFRASLSRCAGENALVAVLTNESIFANVVDYRLRGALPAPDAPRPRDP